ncbi:hypothetical protein [Sinomonas atrocyanea]|jgi:hypothetical protein|uniref:hypothetical protein n=1 Tax=Sinomonas atrocyanea TaxID=37927 RepID=UPI002786B200|nr:hypothetical protein [Sinomonas atrocyanea]MDQ0261873.1 hypothetical protein [Sinomonas atrocyanea]MDR6623289.1 hypothetical protein [Sinomonas atrocyanea]
MPVSALVFRDWLQELAPGNTAADICRRAGLKRSTLAQQLVRGKVAEATVVAVARAYGENPVLGLARFAPYGDLASSTATPTDAELLSQVSTARLLEELLVRGGELPAVPPASHPGPARAESECSSCEPDVRQWVDAIDDGDLRQRVSEATGIAPQNLSAQLRANRLSPELAVSTAREAGVGLRNGLVITGLVTATEAGWPLEAWEQAVRRLPDAELAFMAAERLASLGRALRRTTTDARAVRRVWEHLG